MWWYGEATSEVRLKNQVYASKTSAHFHYTIVPQHIWLKAKVFLEQHSRISNANIIGAVLLWTQNICCSYCLLGFIQYILGQSSMPLTYPLVCCSPYVLLYFNKVSTEFTQTRKKIKELAGSHGNIYRTSLEPQ